MTETNINSEPAGNEAFLAVLKKSGLVPVEKLGVTLAEFHDMEVGDAEDVLPVARNLIAANLLTRWQYDKLIKGRYKGFFLGKYRLLDHLGTGGMSTVYLAEHSLTGQKRAIKVLPRKKMAERSYLARFYREGRAVAALNHPNIVRIYDIADEWDTHYMVMEFIEGCDLFDFVIDRGPVDFDMARDCIIQAARGLAHAHEKKLIHRDIKPANLFRTVGGTVKVLDLGLALLKSESDDHGLSKQHNEQTMGTADYLAPEQAINSHDVDQRADIYSLGCTLFYLLTGRPPFNEGTLAQRIAMHQSKQPPEIRHFRPDCPEYLVAICNQMMQKDADHRFHHCDEVIAALESRTVPQRKQAPVDSFGNAKSFSVVPPATRPSEATQKSVAAIKRKRYPWELVAMFAVLAIVPIVLAILAFSSPTGATIENNSDVPGEPATGHVDGFDLVGDQNFDLQVFEDFETPVRFPERQKPWDLIESGIVVGTLLTRGKCRVVTTPESSPADNGQHCLLIAGDSDEVEFRPEHPDSRIEQIRFVARRTSDNLPFEFDIEAKSNQQSERWKTVFSATDLISASEFNEIIVGPKDFDTTESRKFRFKVVGGNDVGVYIDNLKIELK